MYINHNALLSISDSSEDLEHCSAERAMSSIPTGFVNVKRTENILHSSNQLLDERGQQIWMFAQPMPMRNYSSSWRRHRYLGHGAEVWACAGDQGVRSRFMPNHCGYCMEDPCP